MTVDGVPSNEVRAIGARRPIARSGMTHSCRNCTQHIRSSIDCAVVTFVKWDCEMARALGKQLNIAFALTAAGAIVELYLRMR